MIYAITMLVLVLMAQFSMMRRLRPYDNALLTNLRKVQQQLCDYEDEVKHVIIPGIKQARGLGRKIHKISAFGEEFVDKMPRLVWYTALYGTLFTLIGAQL